MHLKLVARRTRRVRRPRRALRSLPALLALAVAACGEITPPPPVADPTEGLLFTSTRGGAIDVFNRPMSDIFRIAADGTQLVNLTQHPTWMYEGMTVSPDGHRVAFASDRDGCDIWVMGLDGGNLSKLTNAAGGSAQGCNGQPAWSPDGQRIAFASNRANRTRGTTAGLPDVWVMNADGSDPRNLSGQLGEEMGYGIHFIAWTPDGRVVFETFEVALGVATSRRSYSVRPDASDLRAVLEREGDHSPAWSPDGSLMAFISDREGHPALFLMNADGSDPRRLTDASGPEHLPLVSYGTRYDPWSPDGTRIAFERRDGPEAGIYTIHRAGHSLTPVTTVATGFSGWSPSGTRIALTRQTHGTGSGSTDVWVVDANGTGAQDLTHHSGQDRGAVWVSW